ncbi:MarR family winged helix-turn-helix transcriptional regulator, partial [Streptomyces sp. NPDC054796]
GAVAARLRVARSTVSNLVRVMSAAGLVERVRSAHDQRTVVLTASREALELLECYDRASAATLTRVVDELSPADRVVLAQVLPALGRLVTTLEATDEAGGRTFLR